MRSHSRSFFRRRFSRNRSLLRMNFRRTKIARTRCSVQSFESREELREAVNDLTFTGKEAGVYFPRPQRSSYARRAYISHAVMHTHTYKTRVLADLSRGQPRDSRSSLHVSFLSRDACVTRGGSSLPLAHSPPYLLSFFRHRFSPLCAPNFKHDVRRRRPWCHAAIGQA